MSGSLNTLILSLALARKISNNSVNNKQYQTLILSDPQPCHSIEVYRFVNVCVENASCMLNNLLGEIFPNYRCQLNIQKVQIVAYVI